MDVYDAVPPAIRRSPRAVLAAQKQHRDHRTLVFDEFDEELDEAAPPPIARSRSASIDGEQDRRQTSRSSSISSFNPLQSHPVDTPPKTPPTPKFSRPFREPEPQHEASPDPPLPVEPSIVRRHPRGLISYRNNKREINNIKRLPPHLRRQTSLETINSVTTVADDDRSEYGHDPPEVEAPSPDCFTSEDHAPSNPPPSLTSKPSSINSSSGSSKRTCTPVETPLEYASLDHHTPQSLFKKMMPRKLTDKPQDHPPSPNRLVIEKAISIDRISRPSTLSGSTTSVPDMQRIPLEERSLRSILDNAERSRSGSKSSGSSKWSASDFDTSTLTEAEIKKCQKKGINPALYAEMRAAKKGKWTSPIAGHTFL
ncbi:Alpha beta-hydrolase [Pyrenophora seminiperda CCB06]|uniref:Alpha beta-hydrolase n=1 Tax=Pyrenophora seminiperda CCB06 TaxID=1302712 RepID=A0A3M7M4J2_9PLEO|nr:Alpha beta-hydrolase [Pyrenophora seminiperda CCB06]